MSVRLKAIDYFRAGRDTDEIAAILKITEAEALKQVSSQRSALLGRHDPYEPEEPKRPLVRYAGR